MEATATRHETAEVMPSIGTFFTDGLKFVQSMKETGSDPCHAITPDGEEWREWGAYFMETYGRVPSAFRQIERGQLDVSFTVPAQWPQWFDKRWAPGLTKYVPERRHKLTSVRTPEEAAMAERLVASFKRGLTKNPEKIL